MRLKSPDASPRLQPYLPMKPIIVIILAIAVGYAGYEYAYPVFADMMKFTRHEDKVEEPKKEVVAVVPAPKREVKVEPAPMPAPEPKPEPAAPKMDTPKAPVVAVDPNAFVPPTYPSAQELTQNWTVVPKGFFTSPKQVTLKKDVEIKMQMGAATAASNFKAGAKVFVTDQQGPNLIVSAAAGSSMRGALPMDDTDFKDVFTAAYDQLNVQRVEAARRTHAAQLAAAERAKSAPTATASSAGNAKPTRAADGTYPLLLASMKSGEVTEIKPDNIKSWSDVGQETIDGTEYWTVNVKYETQTMFGKFETEAQARIKNGKVDKWVYTGSGEVVP